MSQPAAAAMDPAAHVGAILFGSTNVFIGSRPAARQGDPISCSLHGGGTITRGSATVFINGMPAARLGDMTGCLIPGLAAISVPSLLGPPPAPAGEAPLVRAITLDKSRRGKTHAENDEAKGGASALHMEGSMTDANADGNYDTLEGSAEVVRLRQKGYTNVGASEVSGTHNIDVIYGSAKYSSIITPESGQAVYGSAEAGMIKWSGTVGVAPPGSKGLNAHSIGGELNLFHAKAEGDWLAGDDGNRVGVVAKGEAGAEAVKGEISTVVTSRTVWGYNAQFTQKGGAAGGTVGGGAGFWAYFDKKQSRVHIGEMAKLKLLFGLEGEWNVSIGKAFKEDPPAAPAPAPPAPPVAGGPFGGYLNTPGMGVGGLPGTIMMGNFTVLIGG